MSPSDEPIKTLGIIDLGSNSVRLIVVDVAGKGSYRYITEEKAVLRLAAGLERDGAISRAGLERTLSVLDDFMRIARSHGASVYQAVATAAVRQARNGAEFVQAVSARTGVGFRVISEVEEAELAFTGAINTLSETDGFLIDVGGGSTELVRFADRRITHSASLPFGAVNLTERFLPGGSGSAAEFAALSAFLTERLLTVPWLHTSPGLPLVGVGGTIRNLARMDRKARRHPLEILHGYRMAPAAVEDAYTVIRSTPEADRSKIPGLSAHRSDIIAGGLALVWHALARTCARELVISGAGVREGLLYQYLLGAHRPSLVPDVLEHSIAHLLHTYGLSQRRSREAVRLALALYDALEPVHGLDRGARRCQVAAAALSDLGLAVNVYGQDQHTFYLVTRGRLYGLSHRELVITGAAAGYRGYGKAKAILAPYETLLWPGDEGMVRRLGVITALTRELTRYEPGAVRSLRVGLEGSTAILTLESDQVSQAVLQGMQSWGTDFRKAFGQNLVVEVG